MVVQQSIRVLYELFFPHYSHHNEDDDYYYFNCIMAMINGGEENS